MMLLTPDEVREMYSEEAREMIMEDPMWTGFKLGLIAGWMSMAGVYGVVKWIMA